MMRMTLQGGDLTASEVARMEEFINTHKTWQRAIKCITQQIKVLNEFPFPEVWIEKGRVPYTDAQFIIDVRNAFNTLLTRVMEKTQPELRLGGGEDEAGE
jgi:hypothetical protein